jgi:hypothetical protein
MNAKRMKGQAALDFLMTYGWAIALVVIIAAVLFALGIFDVNNFVGNTAVGFSKVGVKGFNMGSDGTFTIKLSNRAGTGISIDNVTISILNTTAAIVQANGTAQIGAGADTAMLTTAAGAFGAQQSGATYSANVVITYTDMDAGFQYTDKGTIRGKAP